MFKYLLPLVACTLCLTPASILAQGNTMSLASSKANEHNVFYKLAQEGIILTDVFEAPWYEAPEQMAESAWDERQTGIWLDTMLADVKFVAGEMRRQMDDQQVVGGRFDGQMLFDVMEASTDQDLLDFFSYVNYKPAKYRDHHWKLSEVYATWIVSETPMPAQLMVDFLWNEQQAEATRGEADCDGKSLYLNIKKGKLNKLRPTASMESVKAALPCFTGETEEGEEFNCGGGLFFLNHNMFFYTYRDYIEVRAGFGGEISEDLLGKTEDEILEIKGQPDRIPVYEDKEGWGFEVDKVYLYKTKYGTLQINFDPESGKSVKLAIHSKKVEEVIICW